MIRGNKYSAMICDREHNANGSWYASLAPSFSFAVFPELPAMHENLDDHPTMTDIKKVTLYYGTFNGVPVWTREKVET
jgi:hypothetical protein